MEPKSPLPPKKKKSLTYPVWKGSVIENNAIQYNTCVQLCALLCLHGSRYEASNSLNFITNLYSLDKCKISNVSFMSNIINTHNSRSADMMPAGATHDSSSMRDQNNTNFMSNELNELKSFFCLDHFTCTLCMES